MAKSILKLREFGKSLVGELQVSEEDLAQAILADAEEEALDEKLGDAVRIAKASRRLEVLDQSVDSAIQGAIQVAKDKIARPDVNQPYNHRLYNRLLEDFLVLIDRANTYRKEAELLAEAQISETYRLFSAIAKRQILRTRQSTRIDDLIWIHPELKATNNLAAVLRTESPEEPGFADLLGANELNRLLGDKLATDLTEPDAIVDRDRIMRQADPSSVLNYAERYTRALDLLVATFTEAYEKLHYLHLGVKSLGLVPDAWLVANPLPNGNLQEFTRWSNSLSVELDRYSMRDAVVEWVGTLGTGAIEDLVSQSALDALATGANTSFSVSFDVPETVLPKGNSHRIRSIAIDCMMRDEQYTDAEYPVKLTLPNQLLPGGTSRALPVEECRMKHVKHPHGSSWFQRLDFLNADPKGRWSMEITKGFSKTGGVDPSGIKAIIIRVEIVTRRTA